MAMAIVIEVTSLLIDIEAGLRQLNLWQQQPPAQAALQSRQPFCIDTLNFPQWLQFIFLPRMYGLIEAERLLPDKCQIGPMADEYFKPLGFDADSLVHSIYCLDWHLSQS
jgi:uncharacterized protein YqcC (DUF446 family)